MGHKATITVVIVVYNAERFIRGCLESIKGWVDEIIVVDMFSSDNTVEIAGKYTDKIFQDESDSIQRTNIGIDKAISDWILLIGATEVITEELRGEIIVAINNNKYVGYYVPRLNYFWGKLIPERPGTLYLFKRGYGKYNCFGGHEKISLKGNVGYLNNFRIHWGNHVSIKDGINKTNLYTSHDAHAVFAGHPRAFFWNRPVHRANIVNMLYRPIVGFFSYYILGRGYRYGMHGFIIAINHAFNFFLEIAKLYELQYKKEHNIDDITIPPDLHEQEKVINKLL